MIPIGGGGLAAGIALALRELRPELRLVGVQAAACAPLAGLEPAGLTIADGIAVKRPGELTSSILRDLLDEIVAVDDEVIARAIVLAHGGELTAESPRGSGARFVLRLPVPPSATGPARPLLHQTALRAEAADARIPDPRFRETIPRRAFHPGAAARA